MSIAAAQGRPVPDRVAFVEALEQEAKAFADFAELLETESECLRRGDVDALLTLSRAKADHTAQLAQLFERRQAFLRQEGFKPDRIGMSEWLVVHAGPDTQRLSDLWKAVLESASHAQRLNEANGALINVRLRNNAAALSALQAAALQVTAYGPDGTNQLPSGTGRPLGSA